MRVIAEFLFLNKFNEKGEELLNYKILENKIFVAEYITTDGNIKRFSTSDFKRLETKFELYE